MNHPDTCPSGSACINLTPTTQPQTACSATTTCIALQPTHNNDWWNLTDTKTPNSPVLQFDTAELDTFTTAWLTGKFGNNPAAIIDQITKPYRDRITAVRQTAAQWRHYANAGDMKQIDAATALNDAINALDKDHDA